MTHIEAGGEEDAFDKDMERLLWIVAFLMIESAEPMLGVDLEGRRRRILTNMRDFIEAYARASASGAASTWKARYDKILQDAINSGRTSEAAIKDIKEESGKMARRMRVAVHDDVMNAFRNTLKEITLAIGADNEQYLAMPGADEFCTPYDKQIYRAGIGPIPPIHWGCRCIRIPFLRGL